MAGVEGPKGGEEVLNTPSVKVEEVPEFNKREFLDALITAEGYQEVDFSTLSVMELEAIAYIRRGDSNFFDKLDLEEPGALAISEGTDQELVKRGIYYRPEETTWKEIQAKKPQIVEAMERMDEILKDDITPKSERKDAYKREYNSLLAYGDMLGKLDVNLRRKQRLGGVSPIHREVNDLRRTIQGKVDNYWDQAGKLGSDFQNSLD